MTARETFFPHQTLRDHAPHPIRAEQSRTGLGRPGPGSGRAGRSGRTRAPDPRQARVTGALWICHTRPPLFRNSLGTLEGPRGRVGSSLSALDPEMLRRVRDRDPQAMEVFFDHFFDRAYGFAVHLVGDASLADDLVQEAFLKMHGALDRLDPDRDPSAWVFTILRNVARDHWRSRAYKTSQQNTDLDEAWDVASPDAQTNPHRTLERTEDARAVQEALQTLSPADREVLLMKEYQGMSTADIAAVLGKTPEAIRQRHSRAVRRLGEAYRSRLPEEST